MVGTLKFRCTVGALIRGGFTRGLQNVCFDHDLSLEITESKGFFESEFYIKITGEQAKITVLAPNIKKWLEKMSSEE